MSAQATREHIVEAADDLFYQSGYDHTSFADIADVVKISRGNFYFHFKSKDEILDAVIVRRLAGTQQMLDRWESEGRNPAERIRSFVDMLIINRPDIKRFGCPVGTLCTELAKLNHASKTEASKLFALFRAWLRAQFELLGQAEHSDAQAMHLLARSQGIATLFNALHDDRFVQAEVQQMHAWLDAIVNAAPPSGRLSKAGKAGKKRHVHRPTQVFRQ